MVWQARRFVGLILLLILFSPLTPAGAQGSVRDVVMAVEVAYGLNWRFTLTAESEVEIAQAELFAAAPGLPFTYTTVLPVHSRQIALDYTLPLQTIRPWPFAPITYWWVLETDTGERITLETATFIYGDSRFDWQNRSEGDLILHWTTQAGDFPAEAILRIARSSQQTLNRIMPIPVPVPLNIYVYPSTSDLRSALRLGNREWQDGHVGPDLGVILVVAVNPRTAEDDLAQTIAQEMSRLYLYEATQAQYEVLPRWLVEGMAGVVVEADKGWGAVVQTAAANDSLFSLVELCTAWPTDPAQTPLAIAQSMALTDWLKQEFGDLGLNRLIHAYQSGQDCLAGLTTATNLSTLTLAQQWQTHLQGQPTLVRLIQQNGLWLLFVLAGFLLTVILVFTHWEGNQPVS
jgi:hypothetical protein